MNVTVTKATTNVTVTKATTDVTVTQPKFIVQNPGVGQRLTDSERNRIRSQGLPLGTGFTVGQDRFPNDVVIARQPGIWEVNNGGSGVDPPVGNYWYSDISSSFYNTLTPQNPNIMKTFGFPLRLEHTDETFRVPAMALLRGGGITVRVLGGMLNDSGSNRVFTKVIDWNGVVLTDGSNIPQDSNKFAVFGQHVRFRTINAASPGGIATGLVAQQSKFGADMLVPFEWTTRLDFIGHTEGVTNNEYRMFVDSRLSYTFPVGNDSAVNNEGGANTWEWKRRVRDDNTAYIECPDPTQENYFAVKFGVSTGAGTYGTGDPMMLIEYYEVTLHLAHGVRL